MLNSGSLCYCLLTNYLTSVHFLIYKIGITIDCHKKLSIFKAQLCMALEKEMATHSSILAWRISGTEEPNGLPSMGSQRVRHD